MKWWKKKRPGEIISNRAVIEGFLPGISPFDVAIGIRDFLLFGNVKNPSTRLAASVSRAYEHLDGHDGQFLLMKQCIETNSWRWFTFYPGPLARLVPV